MTDYSYTREWSSSHIASDAFQDSQRHANPRGAWPAEAASFAPPALHAGAFLLPAALQARLGGFPLAPLPFSDAAPACGAPANASRPPGCAWSGSAGGLYYHDGASGDVAPAIGDLRVTWAASSVTAVSFIGTQTRSAATGQPSLAPFYARSGHTCFLLEPGLLSPAAMIAAAKARNAALTWLLRALGCGLNWVGITLFLAPLGVLIDVVPIVGPFVSDLVAMGTGVAAAAVSLALCAFTIALAWLAVRPAVGVPLLLLSAAAAGGLAWARERRRRNAAPGGADTWGHAGAYSAELNDGAA